MDLEELRVIFEAQASDSFQFVRSRRGNYRNPAVARDWKWFVAGYTAATGRFDTVQVSDAAAQRTRAGGQAVEPPFYASGVYVRGPARPDGDTGSQIVFQTPSEAKARMTAENLNALFTVLMQKE